VDRGEAGKTVSRSGAPAPADRRSLVNTRTIAIAALVIAIIVLVLLLR
jgi:hypothetical protein